MVWADCDRNHRNGSSMQHCSGIYSLRTVNIVLACCCYEQVQKQEARGVCDITESAPRACLLFPSLSFQTLHLVCTPEPWKSALLISNNVHSPPQVSAVRRGLDPSVTYCRCDSFSQISQYNQKLSAVEQSMNQHSGLGWCRGIKA